MDRFELDRFIDQSLYALYSYNRCRSIIQTTPCPKWKKPVCQQIAFCFSVMNSLCISDRCYQLISKTQYNNRVTLYRLYSSTIIFLFRLEEENDEDKIPEELLMKYTQDSRPSSPSGKKQVVGYICPNIQFAVYLSPINICL